MTRRGGLAWRATAIPLALLAATACNLVAGIDSATTHAEPPRDAGPDATLRRADPEVDAGAADAVASEATPPCSADGDCKSAVACLAGRCDRESHRCIFEMCPQATKCWAATCDAVTGRCSEAVHHGFYTTEIAVDALSSSCLAGDCFAAIWPFVFVVTKEGLVAYQVANPTNGAPVPSLVEGVGFLPEGIVASGRRLYATARGSSPGQGRVAWIDTPGDPFASPRAAGSVTVDLQGAVLRAGHPGADGELLLDLYFPEAEKFSPAALPHVAILQPPIPLVANPLPIADPGFGQSVWATIDGEVLASERDSNTASLRVIRYRFSGGQWVADPGIVVASLSPSGSSHPPFSLGPNGSGLFGSEVARAIDGGFEVPWARAGWVIPGGKPGRVDGDAAVAVATYDPPGLALLLSGAPVGGMSSPGLLRALAAVDRDQAIVVTARTSAGTGAVVEVLSRADGAAALRPNRRADLSERTGDGRVVASGSEGMGYVAVITSSRGEAAMRIHAFATACDD